VRALIVASTTIALIAACNDRDVLPTMPPIAVHSTIAGADVTTLGFEVAAINDVGQVAGTLNGRAVRWTPAQGILDLGTLGGTLSRAYAINASGQVAGASTTATGATHAFLWTPGQGMQDLGTLGGGPSSTARGINDQGQVVGGSRSRRWVLHSPRSTPSCGHRVKEYRTSAR
jgi:probable HAF family extracellular repeat protein